MDPRNGEITHFLGSGSTIRFSKEGQTLQLLNIYKRAGQRAEVDGDLSHFLEFRAQI